MKMQLKHMTAIEINPQLAETWHNKGNALKALGRTAETDAAFAKAKELGYKLYFA
jgi:Flp pilus assembly protein TadD